jgi:hypothetical protein
MGAVVTARALDRAPSLLPRFLVSRAAPVVKTFLLLLLTTTLLVAAEPSREGGLSVHMLPERVARLGNEHGGFTVTDPGSKNRGATYAEPGELLTYFRRLPADVQQNGIWIVTTDPSAYSKSEHSKLKALIALCAQQKIPLYLCRAIELPNGWKPAT